MSTRVKVFIAVVGLLAVAAAVLGVRYWWDYGYARGTRTGVLRKISIKGPPYCKFVDAELAITGTAPGQPAEIWHFSVDNQNEHGPLMDALHAAEKSGKLVTVQYRQDRHMWWRCTDTESFVTGIEKD